MISYKILGLIGLIFSAIAAALGITLIAAAFAFILWIISIIIRGPAWILLSKESGKNCII